MVCLGYCNFKGPSSVEFLHGYLDALLRKVLDIILLKDFESGLFGNAGAALFWLILLREVFHFNTNTSATIHDVGEPSYWTARTA
jgi:hypothetical protein